MEDEKIIDLFFARDESGIEEASQKYGKYLYTVAFRILDSAEDSEECVNDTWVKTWNAVPPERPSILKAFLVKITRNLSLNRLEERKAEKRGAGETALCLDELEECVACRDTVEDQIDREVLAEALNAFLAGLTDDRRQLFLARYWYFYPIRDIALMYGSGESRVKTALFRIRQELKAYLLKEGFTV